MNGLISEIRQAFKGVTLEDGISLNMTEYLDTYKHDKKYLDAAEGDEKADWEAIPAGTLEKHTVTFSFTDAKGFRFYLPAYMCWRLNNPTSSAVIGDHTIYALDTDAIERLYKKTVTEILSTEQIKAVIKFLRWCCENEGYCDSEAAAINLGKLNGLIGKHE